MKFKVNKSSLIKVLSYVCGAVERKNTIAILQNVKIEARAGLLNLTTTDMDIVVTAKISDVNIEDEGSTTVPAQLIFDIIKKIPDETNISFELQENEILLILKYGKSKFTLPCLDPVEFPVLSEGEMDYNFNIEAKDLAKIIDKTKFAIATDDTKYYLNGLFIHGLKNNNGNFEVRGVATDGHRLTLASTTNVDISSEFKGVIIPRKTIGEIRRIIDGNEKVSISLSKSKVMVNCENCKIISKLIDGQFPDYDKVIPKENNKVININKKIIYDAIDRVSTIASDKSRTVKIILENNKLELKVSSTDGSFANEELETDFANENDKIEAGFNSRYLLEIINQMDQDNVNLKFQNNFSPVIIDHEGFNGLYVIMPVRV